MGRVASPPGRPTLVYDGDCGFCRYWIRRWKGATAGRVDFVPHQEAAGQFPEISVEEFQESVRLVAPDGTVTSGARAVFTALSAARGRGGPLLIYNKVPGAAAMAEASYRFVAGRRVLFSTLTRLLWGREAAPPSFRISSRVFLAGIGLIYLVAFASLGVQIRGLAGEHGILPVAPWLEQAGARIGWERFYYVPSLAWLGAGDTALVSMCVAGGLVSLVLVAGIAPGPAAASAWVLYLSLSHATRLFLGFQWDTLLLEAGLLAVFLYPSGWRMARWRQQAPSKAVRFLLWWLLFRLMLGSGVAKLGGGDPVWWDLTAVAFHYETQPLPTWIAWFMHQLPGWFHRASTALMFVAEILLPLLIFAPRRLRLLAFWGMAGFQLALIATGNFAFFNWLSLVLCLLLVDDGTWPGRIRKWIEATAEAPPSSLPGRLRPVVWALVAAVLIVSGYGQAQGSFIADTIPEPVQKVRQAIAPFRSLNSYGLFVNMTTERPEITVEGSMDGRRWEPYAFRWKPGDPGRRPIFVAPHQPRLDWQMWFASLGNCRNNPWLVAFMQRILEGSPQVIGLLENDPFGGRKPAHIRAVLWDYAFSDGETRKRTGAWWTRERKGLYCPVISRPGSQSPSGLVNR